MQNEPNLSKSQIFIILISTTSYSEKCKLDTWSKRTQTNPILSRAQSRDLSKQLRTSGGFKRLGLWGEFLSNQGGKRAKFSNFPLKSRSYHD
jgi:hypothetical protein